MTSVFSIRRVSLLARVAAQQMGRGRLVGAALQGVRITVAHVGRVLHQLWLEVTGFVFLVLAGIGGLAVAHEYPLYRNGKVGLDRVLIAVCFTGLFGWFGMSSFWRARKKG